MGAFANTLSNFFSSLSLGGDVLEAQQEHQGLGKRLQLLPLAFCSMLCLSKEQQNVTPKL